MNIPTLIHMQDITLPSDGVTATKTFTLVHLKRSLDTCDRQQVSICMKLCMDMGIELDLGHCGGDGCGNGGGGAMCLAGLGEMGVDIGRIK